MVQYDAKPPLQNKDNLNLSSRSIMTIDDTPLPLSPRVVTPISNSKRKLGATTTTTALTSSFNRQQDNDDDDNDVQEPMSPLLHQPTATTGGLTHTSPLRPKEPMRYSLNSGLDTYPRISPSKRSGMGSISSSSSSNASKLKAAHTLALQQTMTTKTTDPSALSSTSAITTSKIRKQDPNAYKIFLLLLQPSSKIFELIQLLYSPYDTTIGNLLQMIPKNATEKALGQQEYIGLCRPKTQEELIHWNELASEVRPGVPSAKITLGEILVAIPEGYSGPEVASLSKQILANPKIVKLLKRADPLAPKKRRSSRHRHHRGSSTRNRAAEQVHILEKHDEAEEAAAAEEEHYRHHHQHHHYSKEEYERLMQEAMNKAAAEAEAANAAIPGGGSTVSSSSFHQKYQRSNSISMETNSSMEMSAQESLDESYASWSKSFDASFSAQSSICSGVSKRALKRRQRQAKRMHLLRLSAIAALLAMVLLYWMDPQTKQSALLEQNRQQIRSPMGFMGLIQSLVLLLAFYKIERLIRITMENNNPSAGGTNKNDKTGTAIYMSQDRRCPFLKAASHALQRFQAKYKKRLWKGNKRRNTKKNQLQQQEGQSVPAQQGATPQQQKLRSFSLKAKGPPNKD